MTCTAKEEKEGRVLYRALPVPSLDDSLHTSPGPGSLPCLAFRFLFLSSVPGSLSLHHWCFCFCFCFCVPRKKRMHVVARRRASICAVSSVEIRRRRRIRRLMDYRSAITAAALTVAAAASAANVATLPVVAQPEDAGRAHTHVQPQQQ